MSHTLPVVVGLVALAAGASPAAAAEQRYVADGAPASTAAATGEIVGVVTTDDGSPPGRVVISLSGPNGTSLAVTDEAGRFGFRELIPGRYLLRTHFTSTTGARRVIEVSADASVFESVVMPTAHASSTTVQLAGFGTSGADGLIRATQVGGADAVQVSGPAQPDSQSTNGADGTAAGDPAALAPHDHNAKAWRLRRARRSVLKEVGFGSMASAVDDDGDDNDAGGELALDVPDRVLVGPLGLVGNDTFDPLTDLVGGTPVSGEVQLLTRATLMGSDPLWSTDALPGQIASVSLAPRGDADWAVRGAFEMAAGKASSWVVAGWYNADPHDGHSVQLAMSYSRQAYAQAGDLRPDAALPTSIGLPSREVGSIDALDSWSISPGVTVDYGTTFARYGYLKDGALLSPRAAVTITPFERTRIRLAASQTMTAPGAEQFLPPLDGVWLPPERSFTSLSRFDDLQAERAVHLEVGIEQRVSAATVLGVRRFTQDVNDQLITMFETGRHVPAGTLPAPGGHYYLASASGVTTNGWGISVSHDAEGRVRGVVDYSLVRAEWSPWTASGLSPRTVGVFRTGFERFHDVTTTIETDIPETATRVSARCRINNAYARARGDAVTSGLDARFDVRVMQALPFSPFDGSSWELVIAVRSMFHEQTIGGSVYDELLVVDPPRQFLGGLVVHF